jgi:predicted adenine nucleotide alpha hydrolase (AANH) superfamily ATPase
MPISSFKNDFEVIGLFYNPNIHPYKEYLDRLTSVKKLSVDFEIDIIYEEYNWEDFLKELILTNNTLEPYRCEVCYKMRLVKTNNVAKEMGIRYISTTLLYSIYQKHELIKDVANEVVKDSEFIYKDFRPYYREGVIKSKELAYYRQKYCGCIFSNYDRYKK